MDPERAQTPNVLDYQQWLGYEAEGRCYLVDPFTKERIDPGQLPGIVLQDPELQEGVEYLQQQGGNIHFRLLIGAHRSPADLRAPDNPNLFTDWLTGADAYLCEADYWTPEWHQGVEEARRRGTPPPPRSHSFLVSAIGAAVEAGTPSTSFDYLAQGPEPLTPGTPGYAEFVCTQLWNQLDREVWGFPRLSEKEYNKLFAVANYLREGIMVARAGLRTKELTTPANVLGRLMLRLEGLRNQRKQKNVVMTVGSAHRDLERKLGFFGAKVEPVIPNPQVWEGPPTRSNQLRWVLSTGCVDYLPTQ